jgi:hypothetical protein
MVLPFPIPDPPRKSAAQVWHELTPLLQGRVLVAATIHPSGNEVAFVLRDFSRWERRRNPTENCTLDLFLKIYMQAASVPSSKDHRCQFLKIFLDRLVQRPRHIAAR